MYIYPLKIKNIVLYCIVLNRTSVPQGLIYPDFQMSSLNHEPEGYTLSICGCGCAAGTLDLLACTDSSYY